MKINKPCMSYLSPVRKSCRVSNQYSHKSESSPPIRDIRSIATKVVNGGYHQNQIYSYPIESSMPSPNKYFMLSPDKYPSIFLYKNS